MGEQVPHQSVLLDEVLQVFQDKELGIFVDGTLGAGGHAEALLQAHPELEHYVGIDQDVTARELSAKRLKPFSKQLHLVAGNARHLDKHLVALDLQGVDGMLLDLGVSSMHLDQEDRGFSFRFDGPLDMRMDPSAPLSAADVVNTWSEQELGRIFRDYGEEPKWRYVARALVRARAEKPLVSTQDLVQVLRTVLRPKRHKKTNPATLIFQAIRIAVNDELGALEAVLPLAVEALATGGRLAIISFHSLEDRIVKQFMREAASDKVEGSGIGGMFIDKEPQVKLLTRKPLVANDLEIEANPRSRSAKMRVIEKL